MANAQMFIPSGTTDTENKTFSFNSNAANDGRTFFTGDLSGKFKANTAYTFIITLSNSSMTPRSNMRVVYTDGTRIAITSPSAQNTKKPLFLHRTPARPLIILITQTVQDKQHYTMMKAESLRGLCRLHSLKHTQAQP